MVIIIVIVIPKRCLWCCHDDTVTARVHLVHLTNAEECRVAADLQTKPTNLCCDCESTSNIAIYYYSAQKLTLILPYHGGWKAEST